MSTNPFYVAFPCSGNGRSHLGLNSVFQIVATDGRGDMGYMTLVEAGEKFKGKEIAVLEVNITCPECFGQPRSAK